MTFDEAVWSAIQMTLAKKQYASELECGATHRSGKKVTIAGKAYSSITAAALDYKADPKWVIRYTRDILKNPTGKKKDNSKRKGNTNGGKEVIVKKTDGCEERFLSMKAFAESRGYEPESVREDHRKGMTFEEIDQKNRRLLDKQNSRVVDGRLFETDKEICEYFGMNRQFMYRGLKKGETYQEIADRWGKFQSKYDDILDFKINDSLKLLHIIDLAKESPEKIITLKETDSIIIICPECRGSHAVSVRKIKSYATEHSMAPLCHTCAMRKSRGEDALYHGMSFPSRRAVLQFKGIEKMAPRITYLTKNESMTFEEAVDFLVEEKLEKTRTKKRGYRREFDECYEGGYKLLDFVDVEKSRDQGIDLAQVRVDEDIPLRCPECGSEIKPKKLRYLNGCKPICLKCENERDLHISSYDAVAYIAIASRISCEYQKQEGTYCVDISVTVDSRKIAIEIDGNRYHKDIEADTQKTNILLSNGYDRVVRLREDNVDEAAVPDVPNAINFHFPNNPFQNEKHISVFASVLTKALNHFGLNAQEISAHEIQEIKKNLPQNLTVEKVLEILAKRQ